MLKIEKKRVYPADLVSRRGRFNVSKEFLNNPTSVIFQLFSNFIIVRAEYMYDTDSVEYIAVSKLFSPVEEGYETPDYKITIKEQDDGSYEIKAHRVSDDRGKKLLRLLRKLDA